MKKVSYFQNPVWVHCCWLIMIILTVYTVKPKPDIKSLSTSEEKRQSDFHQEISQAAFNVAEHTNESSPDKNTVQVAQDAKIYAPGKEKNNSTQDLVDRQILGFHEKTKNSQLHYISVGQSNAREYSDAEERQRMDECRKKYDLSIPENGSKCHEYAYLTLKENVDDTVTVQINNSSPISLILSSAKHVHWIIKGNTQNLKLIYVTGYQAAELSGRFNSETVRFSNFQEGSACVSCHASTLPIFHSSNLDSQLQNQLKQYFGKPLDSFQGQYKAKEFVIN